MSALAYPASGSFEIPVTWGDRLTDSQVKEVILEPALLGQGRIGARAHLIYADDVPPTPFLLHGAVHIACLMEHTVVEFGTFILRGGADSEELIRSMLLGCLIRAGAKLHFRRVDRDVHVELHVPGGHMLSAVNNATGTALMCLLT